MIHFEPDYFQKFKFSENQINRYFQSALRDLDIAGKDKFPEVRFTYGYQALIKAGITLIAKASQMKVRSAVGHHVKILEKMSEILKDADVFTIGNVMRQKRNFDFYGGGESVTEKEADDYLKFVENGFVKLRETIRT